MDPEDSGLLFAALADNKEDVLGLVLDTGTDLLVRTNGRWADLDNYPEIDGKTLKEFPTLQNESVLSKFDAGAKTVTELTQMDLNNG